MQPVTEDCIHDESSPSAVPVHENFGCLGACERSAELTSSDAAAPSTDFEVWPELRQPLVEAYLKAHPIFAVVAGRHEYDGQLPDWSAAGIAAEIRAAARGAGHGAGRAGRDARRATRDSSATISSRASIAISSGSRRPRRRSPNPAFYLDWMLDNLDPSPYLTRDYAPLRRAHARVHEVRAGRSRRPRAQIRANLRTPLRAAAARARRLRVRRLRRLLRERRAGIFADVRTRRSKPSSTEANAAPPRRCASSPPGSSRSAPAPRRASRSARRSSPKMLRATERRDDAAGRARGGRPRRSRAQPGRRCARPARTFAPGASIPDVHRQVARQQARRRRRRGRARAARRSSRRSCRQAGVATIPGTEQALVAESPPYNRANSAYIDIPGPYEKGPAVDLLHLAARSVLDGRRAARLHARPGRPAVHVRARGLARALPAVPAREPQSSRSSAGCSSATRSPKAGRTTPRR